jgi:alpha-L-rhamnosidase
MATGSEAQEDPSMISFNHYAYGAVIDWVYRNVAGIAPDIHEPGYKRILFAPRPAQGFSFAKADILTPYGLATIDWKLVNGEFQAQVIVPFGATGILKLPISKSSKVFVNGKEVSDKLIPLQHGSYYVRLTTPKIVEYKQA